MRTIVFFDLPIKTPSEKREYRRFRKVLIKNGFVMMQKSVYSKLVVNNVTSGAVKEKISKNIPPDGIIELLEITENQFARIDYLVGEKQSLVEESMDRLIEV